MIPQTRAGRRQLILDILGRQSVRSQGELLEILSRDGFAVTQATLSRDLLELGAVKVREGRTLVYAVPGQGGDRTARVAPGPEEVSSRLRRLCEELLVTARVSSNLVVIRTPSGAADYLASALDHGNETDVIGTIAGDDTIVIVTGGVARSRALAKRLLALAGGDRAEPIHHPGEPLSGVSTDIPSDRPPNSDRVSHSDRVPDTDRVPNTDRLHDRHHLDDRDHPNHPNPTRRHTGDDITRSTDD